MCLCVGIGGKCTRVNDLEKKIFFSSFFVQIGLLKTIAFQAFQTGRLRLKFFKIVKAIKI